LDVSKLPAVDVLIAGPDLGILGDGMKRTVNDPPSTWKKHGTLWYIQKTIENHNFGKSTIMVFSIAMLNYQTVIKIHTVCFFN
jgi:hypothetical protein